MHNYGFPEMFKTSRCQEAGTMIRGNSLEEDGGINSKERQLFVIPRGSAEIQTSSVNRKRKVNKSPLIQKAELSQVNNGRIAVSLGVCESVCSDINVNTGSLPANTDGMSVKSNSLPTCTGSLPVNTGNITVNKSEKYRNSKFQNYQTNNGLTTCDRPTSKITVGNKSAAVYLQSSIQCKQNIKLNENTDSERDLESTIRQGSNYKQHSQGKPSTEEDNLQGKFPVPMVDEVTVLKFEPLMAIIDKLADGQRVPPQISMQYEMLRFCTLRSYPKENKPFITRLAQAGFYYASNGDELVCYCCASRKSNWVETDIPLDVHRQMNPNCKFLVRNNEVNISVKTSQFLAERTSKSESETSTLDANEVNQTNQNCRDSVRTNKTLVPSTKQSLEKVNCESQACSNVCSSHDKGRQEKQSGTTDQSSQAELTQSQKPLNSRDARTNGITEKTPAGLSALSK